MSDKKTPLYNRHIELSGTMVNFGGFLLPTQYIGIRQEHENVRKKAGLFDVSHMGEFIISGSGSENFLQRVTINDIKALCPGQAQYSAMCYEDGGIIDDLIIYKQKDKYMLVVNAANLEKDYNWLESHKSNDVKIEDKSNEIGLLALQGPVSRNILQPLTDTDLSNIKFYNFVEGRVNNIKCIISRTGYTGELGFELYANSQNIIDLWDSIMNVGESKGLEPAGLGCRDTLRMEMKYVLYGNDIDETTNPLEAGLGWITRLNKNDFLGRKALLSAKRKLKRKLVCIKMKERAIPRKGCPILINDKLIGEITSGTMSPTIGEGIGIGYVNLDYSKSGIEFDIDIRGKLKSAVVIKPPFYHSGSLMD